MTCGHDDSTIDIVLVLLLLLLLLLLLRKIGNAPDRRSKMKKNCL